MYTLKWPDLLDLGLTFKLQNDFPLNNWKYGRRNIDKMWEPSFKTPPYLENFLGLSWILLRN